MDDKTVNSGIDNTSQPPAYELPRPYVPSDLMKSQEGSVDMDMLSPIQKQAT